MLNHADDGPSDRRAGLVRRTPQDILRGAYRPLMPAAEFATIAG